jgi:RND family efflux transporter MFP subunit
MSMKQALLEKRGNRQVRNWRKMIAVFLSLVFLLSAPGCKDTIPGKVTVEVFPAKESKVTRVVEITGALTPNRTVSICSKLSGIVESVSGDVGDEVAAGQLLVQIDTKELNAQLKQAKAAAEVAKTQAEEAQIGIEAAKVELDFAQKAYERIKQLVDAGAAPQSQLDEAESKLEAAKKKYQDLLKKSEAANQTIAAQQAACEVITTQISNSRIISPISGVITNRNINPGELAAPGVPLLTIADLGALKLEGTVAQEVVPFLSVGQKVKVEVDALPDKTFQGKISCLGPVAVTTGQYFPVEITIPGKNGLMAGMTARAVIPITTPKGIVIPSKAVKKENGKTYVFVVSKGKVSRRPVKLGLEGKGMVMVVEGLRSGEEVAVSNVSILRDGMAVAVVSGSS